MNGVCPCLSALSSQPIQVLNYHLLAIKSGHFTDNKLAYSFRIQLGELPSTLDWNLTALLKVEQGHGIHYLMRLPPSLWSPMTMWLTLAREAFSSSRVGWLGNEGNLRTYKLGSSS